jgi:hypothetical protein
MAIFLASLGACQRQPEPRPAMELAAPPVIPPYLAQAHDARPASMAPGKPALVDNAIWHLQYAQGLIAAHHSHTPIGKGASK